MMAVLTIDLRSRPGHALLAKDDWRHAVKLTDLPRWRQLYRELWARGGKSKDHTAPGPWAAHYEADLQALTAAVREAGL